MEEEEERSVQNGGERDVFNLEREVTNTVMAILTFHDWPQPEKLDD